VSDNVYTWDCIIDVSDNVYARDCIIDVSDNVYTRDVYSMYRIMCILGIV